MSKKRYAVEELTCPECGFVAINANGLRGHRQFKHGVRPSGAQLPLQKQDLLVSESKLGQLLDERIGTVSEQLNDLTKVVDELQESFPSIVQQLARRNSISDFPIPEQYNFLVHALHNLDAEAATKLLEHAGRADLLGPATDGEVKELKEQVQAQEFAAVMASLEASQEAKKLKEAEDNIVIGRTDRPGFRYLANIGMSIKE